MLSPWDVRSGMADLPRARSALTRQSSSSYILSAVSFLTLFSDGMAILKFWT